MRRFGFGVGLAFILSAAVPAAAQDDAPSVVVVPQFAIPKNVPTSAGDTGVIARQISDVIASDLRSTDRLVAIGPDRARVYSFPETTAPLFRQWRTTGAKALVTGFVQARDDDRITVGCYLHDIGGGREMTRQGFVIAPSDWRRAAHRCADAIYTQLTGRSGGFDSLIAYVAESGAGANRVKRIAIMDSDGSNHRYVTAGDAIVLTPRLSPDGDRLAYVSLTGGRAQIRIVDLGTNEDRAVSPEGNISFAPRFSPDGRRLVFSMSMDGNTDLYVTDLASGGLLRLTYTPGIDTSPSYSPDGERIVFESDRSGSPQLYIMNSDGSETRRISFGGARYGSPAWSPDGTRIAFTRIDGNGLGIGVMSSSGSDEHVLTSGELDDMPSWGANSRSILFQRKDRNGRTGLYVAIPGSEPRAIITPQGGSDPDWAWEATQ